MSVGHIGTGVTPSTVEAAGGTAFSLLVALAATSRVARDGLDADLAHALDVLGDTEGETWLNLLGAALDAGAPYTATRLVAAVHALDPVELRRHILGRYAWSWCTLGGIDDIEGAAEGDPAAARRLLAKPRYYGGHAEASLRTLLALDPDETRRRILACLEAGARVLVRCDAEDALENAVAAARRTIASESAPDAIDGLTAGYRYVPELEAERVVLLPHLERELPLVLAQHRSARLIAYYVHPDRGAEDRAVALGRALSDPKRVEILALVGRGVRRSADLVDATGLSRSTVHHHLALLREAGLLALQGNARAYTYVPRGDAAAEVASLLADLVGSKEEA